MRERVLQVQENMQQSEGSLAEHIRKSKQNFATLSKQQRAQSGVWNITGVNNQEEVIKKIQNNHIENENIEMENEVVEISVIDAIAFEIEEGHEYFIDENGNKNQCFVPVIPLNMLPKRGFEFEETFRVSNNCFAFTHPYQGDLDMKGMNSHFEQIIEIDKVVVMLPLNVLELQIKRMFNKTVTHEEMINICGFNNISGVYGVSLIDQNTKQTMNQILTQLDYEKKPHDDALTEYPYDTIANQEMMYYKLPYYQVPNTRGVGCKNAFMSWDIIELPNTNSENTQYLRIKITRR